jgi:hypothetical protein
LEGLPFDTGLEDSEGFDCGLFGAMIDFNNGLGCFTAGVSKGFDDELLASEKAAHASCSSALDSSEADFASDV